MKFRHKKQNRNKFYYPFTIKCTCCNQFYPNHYNGDQGHTCASYIYLSTNNNYVIRSEYGSGYDTMKFIVQNNNIVKKKHIVKRNEAIQKDDRNIVICDQCITKLLKNKSITIDHDYNPFAFIDILNSFHAEEPQRYYEILTEGGPSDCMRLIQEERAKPMEKREEERKNRKEIKFIQITNSLF